MNKPNHDNMKKILLSLAFVCTSLLATAQQGGMWVPSLLNAMNESEMQTLGMKMSVEDIYSVNKSSIKDAVPQFNGGCTSEVISPNGLLLTNHHCGYGELQSHTTLENNYLQDGFWAKTYEEELPNPDLEVTFIVSIHDVTDEVLKNTVEVSNVAERERLVEQNINNVQKNFKREEWQSVMIRNFYDGNQYLLFVTESFEDVRLVGAPPSSIGKYGSDTDNWMWPRHTGDFMLFRIYADENNRPAKYSPTNKPYQPKHFLPVSLSGVEEGDFTMVVGYPGRTQEYLPAVAIDQIVHQLNPAKINLRAKALKATDEFMRNDPKIKIQYASKYASIANYWKKWIGENQGIQQSNAIAIKKQYEQDFKNRLEEAGKTEQYGHILSQFDSLYAAIEPYALSRDYFIEIVVRNNELLKVGFMLYQLENAYNQRGVESFNERKAQLMQNFESIYKDYNADVDRAVFKELIQLYSTEAPRKLTPLTLINIAYHDLGDELYQKTALTSIDGVKKLLEGNAKDVVVKLNSDYGYKMAKLLSENYFNNVAPQYDALQREIDALQKEYMKAQLEMFPEGRFFPDANSTLRITYGQVKGYQPKDAVVYNYQTTLKGVMEKYVPKDYEFDLPQKLIDLYKTKDYGIYANADGSLPVNFIGTNHTTGGNSGSPALDAHGNLIGLNFDRVWEGTMSDLYYDPNICRNIMVDARYILFIIDKYAETPRLINEMKLVFPKEEALKKEKEKKVKKAKK